MELLLFIGLFVVSLGVLLFASDKFVGAAEKIGLHFGISPLIIGLTIVAFGTSLPELSTSIAAVFAGSPEIVIGNVVGSNITNILLILGFTAVIGKNIELDFSIIDIDMPLLIASSLLMYFVLLDGDMGLMDAALFLGALLVFLLNSLKAEKTDKSERPSLSMITYVVLILGGLFVYLGANYTIVAITEVSTILNVPSDIIALTAVALGTSLPELVVSIMAARKGQHAIAVGNVIGSNIFNTYAVMAIPRFFGVLVIPPEIIAFSLPFMIAMTLLFAVICLSRRISKWEGVMLLIFYGYYISHHIM